jgi:hypothetical protein
VGVRLVVEYYEKHSSHQTFLVSHNLKMASKISNVSNGRLEPWFTMLVKILTQLLKATMTTLRQHCKLQNQGYHVNTLSSTYTWDVGGYSISLLVLESLRKNLKFVPKEKQGKFVIMPFFVDGKC